MTVTPSAAVGVSSFGRLVVPDVQGVSCIQSVDDDNQRTLNIVANKVAGSAIALATLNQDGTGVTPVLTASSTSVAIAPPIQASSMTLSGSLTATTVQGAIIGDGAATLTKGALTATSVRATTITDGTATLASGALAATSVRATTITDGTATLSSGALTATSVRATTITDGTATLSNGALALKTLTVSGAFSVANIDAATVSVRAGGALNFMGPSAAAAPPAPWRFVLQAPPSSAPAATVPALVVQCLNPLTGTYVNIQTYEAPLFA